MSLQVKFGVDILLTQAAAYQNKRIGLVCNLASVTGNGQHSRLALKEAGFNIVTLFAPEHGFNAKGDDGAFINHQIDAQTQTPIVSLYSEKLSPLADDLADLDLVIIDLPDIGARFYTYLWTMTYVMEACEKHSKPVLVLDRPNPMAHNVLLAEGPILEPSCASFIGRFSIPITHHCTFAELAMYFKAKYYQNLKLDVIKMKNWDRATNSGYHFFPTSPAIQKRATVYTYPGACLFEGLNINEGRGTSHPFQQFGAPWIDAQLLKTELDLQLPEANTEIIEYVATVNPYLGETCYGIRVLPKQPQQFQSVLYFVKLIQFINKLIPNKLTKRNYLTNVNPNGENHLDKLLGIPNAFEKLLNNELEEQILFHNWQQTIKPYLLY